MQLSLYSDYALRVLMQLSLKDEQLLTIQDIAEAYSISRNHLTKIERHLGQLGYIETIRGRNGGMRLARPVETINVGEVIRATEENLALVE